MSTVSFETERPDTQNLRGRKAEIVWYLKASISPEDAAAMASSGYRPPGPCGDCMRSGCAWCDRDPSEQVRVGSARRPSADPRYVQVIVQRFAGFNPRLIRAMPGALALLAPQERLVLAFELGGGMTQAEVARRLKLSRWTVARLKEHALERLALEVWGS